MRLVEQAEQPGGGCRVDAVKTGLVIHVYALGILSLPLGDQVAAIGTVTLNAGHRIRAVECGIPGQEVAAATAHDHVNPIDIHAGVTLFQKLLETDQLIGNVLAAGLNRFGRHVRNVFPVAFRRFGIGSSRCGVGNARGGDHTGGFAANFCQLQRRYQLITGSRAAITADNVFIHANHAHIGFYPRHHGSHSPCGIGHLCVHIVGFG